MGLPAYVTRFELTKSLAVIPAYRAKGVVITGPNTGVYITADGGTEEEVKQRFLDRAGGVYESARKAKLQTFDGRSDSTGDDVGPGLDG